jgi:hypothetical protein
MDEETANKQYDLDNLDDIDWNELERLWNGLKTVELHPACPHSLDAVSVDEDGVYHLRCPECGLEGMTDRRGAFYLGWITE